MENLKAILKTKRGRFALIGIALLVVILFGVGIILPGKRLPPISLAAEEIPLPFNIPFFGHSIPNTLPATWLTMLILIGLGWGYNRALRNKDQPSLFQVAVEFAAEGMLGFVENVGGEHARLFFPIVATFFLFIAISNWCGILPGFGSIGVYAHHHGEEVLVPFFRSANAHLSTTLALAVISVGATQYYGFKVLGANFLNRYINFSASSGKPDPESTSGGLQGIMQKVTYYFEIGGNGAVGLLELILEIIKVLPFAFRLFGNILAGEVLLFVVSFLFSFIFPIIFMGLELFVGVIQALIFAMLTLVFLSVATAHHGDEAEEHA
jgi:F-type H+-transporting ATPase subunit a